MPPKNRIKTFCVVCKNEIERIPSKLRERNYCSRICSNKYQSVPRNSIKIKCCYCKKEFWRPRCQLREEGKNFCSRECKTQNSKNKKEIQCSYCKKNFLRHPSIIREEGKNFCSMSCKYYKMYQEGKFGAKVNKGGIHYSKQEKRLAPIMNTIGFKWNQDYPMFIKCNDRKRIPDFYNLNTKEIIEVFGYYWHRDYPGKQHETPEYVIERYKEVGWNCMVYWTDEFEEFCKKVGK